MVGQTPTRGAPEFSLGCLALCREDFGKACLGQMCSSFTLFHTRWTNRLGCLIQAVDNTHPTGQPVLQRGACLFEKPKSQHSWNTLTAPQPRSYMHSCSMLVPAVRFAHSCSCDTCSCAGCFATDLHAPVCSCNHAQQGALHQSVLHHSFPC